jgi:hypothetical protein
LQGESHQGPARDPDVNGNSVVVESHDGRPQDDRDGVDIAEENEDQNQGEGEGVENDQNIQQGFDQSMMHGFPNANMGNQEDYMQMMMTMQNGMGNSFGGFPMMGTFPTCSVARDQC